MSDCDCDCDNVTLTLFLDVWSLWTADGGEMDGWMGNS
jgi:hypothetical protein